MDALHTSRWLSTDTNCDLQPSTSAHLARQPWHSRCGAHHWRWNCWKSATNFTPNGSRGTGCSSVVSATCVRLAVSSRKYFGWWVVFLWKFHLYFMFGLAVLGCKNSRFKNRHKTFFKCYFAYRLRAFHHIASPWRFASKYQCGWLALWIAMPFCHLIFDIKSLGSEPQ